MIERIDAKYSKPEACVFTLPDAPPDDWTCAHCGELAQDHGTLVDDEWIAVNNEDPDRKDCWICGMCGEDEFIPPNAPREAGAVAPSLHADVGGEVGE